MPLYEYECTSCHRRVEKIQKFSDAPLTVCPHCSGSLERTLTAPAIQFKGSGWYKDLYSSAKPSSASSSDDSKPAASGGEAASGGGEKPAAAAPAPAPATSTTGTPSGSSNS